MPESNPLYDDSWVRGIEKTDGCAHVRQSAPAVEEIEVRAPPLDTPQILFLRL